MSVLCLAVISADNAPLYLRTRNGFEGREDDNQDIQLLYILHASLDVIEERQLQPQNRETYLGLLSQTETYKVFGLLSATRIKIILMVSTNQMLRDTEARTMLKELHSSYVDVTAHNPFYIPGNQIKSKTFDKVVKNVFENY